MPMLNRFTNYLSYYLQLMRVEKPIGSLLLLWPTLWALWIAGDGRPDATLVWVFVLGVFVMRSAGCVINDYADRDFDPKVERTKQRPLAAGYLQPKQALGLFMLLGLLALGLLLLLPPRVWPWSIPAVVITIAYPFMKRLIQTPQLVLGVAFSFGMPMVYVAMSKSFDLVFVLLFVVNFCWVLVYDTEYAMSDREDDLKVGVKSTALFFGNRDKQIIAALQALILVLLLAVMFLLKLHISFLFSLVLVAILFVYQQWLIKDRGRQDCFRAFLNNAWVGAIIWFGLCVC